MPFPGRATASTPSAVANATSLSTGSTDSANAIRQLAIGVVVRASERR